MSSHLRQTLSSLGYHWVMIKLSWLILHNLQVDWKMKSLHFASLNEIMQKYEAFPTSTLDSKHDSTHEDTLKN
jgi:hypothetical protein